MFAGVGLCEQAVEAYKKVGGVMCYGYILLFYSVYDAYTVYPKLMMNCLLIPAGRDD